MNKTLTHAFLLNYRNNNLEKVAQQKISKYALKNIK